MIRVLHVDDEVGFLDLVGFFLKREGDFEVDTTTTAESALEKMQSEKYDAVVVDYSLPGNGHSHWLWPVHGQSYPGNYRHNNRGERNTRPWCSIRDARSRRQLQGQPRRSVVGIPS